MQESSGCPDPHPVLMGRVVELVVVDERLSVGSAQPHDGWMVGVVSNDPSGEELASPRRYLAITGAGGQFLDPFRGAERHLAGGGTCAGACHEPPLNSGLLNWASPLASRNVRQADGDFVQSFTKRLRSTSEPVPQCWAGFMPAPQQGPGMLSTRWRPRDRPRCLRATDSRASRRYPGSHGRAPAAVPPSSCRSC